MAHFFISYASEDIAKAREICALLTSLGATYWIAPDHIDPGEAYTLAIPKAIRECDIFLLLFSESSDKSEDVMSEVTLARKYRKRLVPLRLSDYEPQQLEYHLGVPQWIDWHTPVGEPRLRTLTAQIVRATPTLAAPVPVESVSQPKVSPSPDMEGLISSAAADKPRSLPNAVFVRGMAHDLTLKQRVEQAEAADRADQSRLHLPGDDEYWISIPVDPRTPGTAAFRIGRFPVTVWEYDRYLQDSGVKYTRPDDWDEQSTHPGRPASHLGPADAQSYCAWASRKWSIRCTLPTERQWLFAAYGSEGRFFPWGSASQKPDERLANFDQNVGAPSPVGLFPDGETPEGVSDMAGNVWEWTENGPRSHVKVLLGGCWNSDATELRSAQSVDTGDNYLVSRDFGFRVIRQP